MNPLTPPDATEAEWALQERAREEEALKIAAGPTVRLNRYRLIARVLQEPPRETLPDGLSESILAAASATASRSAIASQLGLILISIGGGYAAAMTVAVLRTRIDIGQAIAALDRPMILIAIATALALAAARAFAVIRLLRSPLVTRA